jgi:hypothetical protein
MDNFQRNSGRGVWLNWQTVGFFAIDPRATPPGLQSLVTFGGL